MMSLQQKLREINQRALNRRKVLDSKLDVCFGDKKDVASLVLENKTSNVSKVEDSQVRTENGIKILTSVDKNNRFYGKKIVVYTCITGAYDNLQKPSVVRNDINYVCFTDDKKASSDFWDLRPIPIELKTLSLVKQQRNIKILAHKYLSEFDVSIWIDGVVDIRADIVEFLVNKCNSGNILIPTHPQRSCIYREMSACEKLKKDKREIMLAQINRYKSESYPHNNGLVQSNIIVRFHNELDCIDLMKLWASELNRGSHRDQLSFNYALWKLGTKSFVYLDKRTCQSKYFKWESGKHNKFKNRFALASNKESNLVPYAGKVNILIVHYNTPELTEALVCSINKFVKNACIYIFDNSDTKPFTATYDNVCILDNTHGLLANFDKVLSNYPNRMKSGGKNNKFASFKHCYSVQRCFDIINDSFILMDSDILLKKDISNLFNEKYIFVGEVEQQEGWDTKRVKPYLCFINVKQCKSKNINYFNDKYMHGLYNVEANVKAEYYDTGANFLREIEKEEYLEVDTDSYMIHYGGASWLDADTSVFLQTNSNLFNNEKYLVSLTTYPIRFDAVTKTLQSILDNSVKPDKICLTIFKDDMLKLTDELKSFISNGSVEVIIANEDIRPHKKYFYVMQKYPEYNIITIDDDVTYDKDFIATMKKYHTKYPHCICAKRVHLIKYDDNGLPIKYKKWGYEYKEETNPSKNLFFTGVGGVLYPKHVFNITNEDLKYINEIITADDIYLNFLARKNNVEVVWIESKNVMPQVIKSTTVTKTGLCYENTEGNNPKNDIYLKKFILKKDGSCEYKKE